uniref:C2H2-type domain-containing protein n=1 Tax=Timema poppense TaxID=170557 RepID=A0A7R9HG71_TIMPO|nr:unnamed protein product [Timema poppensis]
MWVHRRKQYVCEVCGCAVKSQQGLDEHRHAMHPGENRHICFQCGKSFVSRQGLWEHGRVHGRGPPGVFHCQQCSKQFTSPTKNRKALQDLVRAVLLTVVICKGRRSRRTIKI